MTCGVVCGADYDGVCARSISTIVDLLEAKGISWAEYQENMPYDGFQGFKCVSPSLPLPLEHT